MTGVRFHYFPYFICLTQTSAGHFFSSYILFHHFPPAVKLILSPVFLIYSVARSFDCIQTRLASANKQTLHHMAFCPLCHFSLFLFMSLASFFKLQITLIHGLIYFQHCFCLKGNLRNITFMQHKEVTLTYGFE